MRTAEPDEAELIRRAAQGDDDAFRRLVARVLPRLRRWALVRMGDEDDADEAVQRTLIAMHGALRTFRGRGRLSSWLYRILANACADLDRSGRREGRRRQAGAATPGGEPAREPTADTPDPVRAVHAERIASAVRDLFDALPARQREVLVMVDHEGMRPIEVAEALGMNPITVRANLLRARRALRRRILERYPDLSEGYST